VPPRVIPRTAWRISSRRSASAWRADRSDRSFETCPDRFEKAGSLVRCCPECSATVKSRRDLK